ncbi:hypothetical protein KC316_g525 [Hortaea werneckii]|nr:hypothetical protein KC324_g1620 [Hortaea werneckii]KAI7595461.1 hypothetical protein KC316_g525 [Hortaea werneckii]
MALLNISNDWLDADSTDSYMLLQNGDDFDLHLPPLVEFQETRKLLDVITTEGDLCRVLLSKKTFYSNLEVAYVLKTDRGSRNLLMTLPKEVRLMIFQPCLQYDPYAPLEKFLPALAALERWSRPRSWVFNSPACLEEVICHDTEYTMFGVPLPPITAVSKQLRSETLDTYASLNHFHLTSKIAKCLPRSDKIRVQGTTSLLQSMKKITYTGHFYDLGCEMALLLVAMKERGFLHPMLELSIRLHYGPLSGEEYHDCRPQLIHQDLHDHFDKIGKALGRGKDMTTAQWEQAQD